MLVLPLLPLWWLFTWATAERGPVVTVEALRLSEADESTLQTKLTALEAALYRVPLRTQRRDAVKKRNFNQAWQYGQGRQVNTVGLGGFQTPHNFRKGIGVYMGNAYRTDAPVWKHELWETCAEILELIDPNCAGSTGDYCVNFARMDDSLEHYVKEHIDGHDVAYQLAVCLGDFKGGELRCTLADGTSQMYDNTRKFVQLDGRLPHRVEPFIGVRFSVIFYKVFDRRLAKALPVTSCPRRASWRAAR